MRQAEETWLGQNANGMWGEEGRIWDILTVEPSGLQVCAGEKKRSQG